MGRIYKTDTLELKKAMVEKGLDKIVALSLKSGIDRAGLIFFNHDLRIT